MAFLKALLRLQAPPGLSPKATEGDLPDLQSALYGTDALERRAAAARILSLCDTRASKDGLCCAMMDGCGLLSESVAEALMVLRGASSVEPLCSALLEGCATVREGAALALGRIADPRSRDALEEAAQDEDDLVRTAAKDALLALPADELEAKVGS